MDHTAALRPGLLDLTGQRAAAPRPAIAAPVDAPTATNPLSGILAAVRSTFAALASAPAAHTVPWSATSPDAVWAEALLPVRFIAPNAPRCCSDERH